MLITIVGSMFAEKSTELQRRGKRLQRAGMKVIFVKPDFDNRYSDDEIVTHDGKKVKAFNLDVNNPLELVTVARDYDAILIDEIQFFDQLIITVVKSLLFQGKTVIVSGLDLDWKGEPFFNTTALMGYAEEVLKLQAVCNHCSNDAWISAKRPNGNTDSVQVGTDDIYFPLCRKCYTTFNKGAK